MKAKVLAILTLLAFFASECNSSAIPMWEYLSRDEKVSKAANAILCFIKIQIKSSSLSEKFYTLEHQLEALNSISLFYCS